MPRLLGVDIPNDKKAVISLTYLYGVGSQTARDLCHKAGVDPDKKARDLTDEELSGLAKIIERDYIVEGGLRRQLQQSINRLKEPYRSLVVLRDIHQHSYAEVAGVLELSLAQVKTYLHRARKQLREQLAEVRP